MRLGGAALYAACLAAVLDGCERDPLELPCPAVGAGELVVTEVSADWIEVYNASGRALDLLGARLALTRLDGASSIALTVAHPLEIAAAGYAPIEFDESIYDGAAIDVVACGERIDRVIYRDAPRGGTLALDGATDPPSAADNDRESAWCLDAREQHGTPGERNPVCERD